MDLGVQFSSKARALQARGPENDIQPHAQETVKRLQLGQITYPQCKLINGRIKQICLNPKPSFLSLYHCYNTLSDSVHSGVDLVINHSSLCRYHLTRINTFLPNSSDSKLVSIYLGQDKYLILS